MSALKYDCRRKGSPHDLSTDVIRSILKGIGNLDTKRHTEEKAQCTLNDLGKLCRVAEVTFDKYKGKLMKSMMTLAFFGFLRISEYTSTCADHTIRRSGCSVEENALIITLPSSKTSRVPVRVKVNSMRSLHVCPVRAFKEYAKVRPTKKAEQLFVNSDGLTITSIQFSGWLQSLCSYANVVNMTPHAFRIGGATWAARVGWSDARIRSHGRWHSDAFLRYVRPV